MNGYENMKNKIQFKHNIFMIYERIHFDMPVFLIKQFGC